MPRGIFEYIDRGAEDEIALRHNRQAYRSLKIRNRVLKDVFKGAATTVVTQGGDDPLYQAYRELASNGTKPNLAKVTLARRIPGTVLRMWKDEEVYQPERVLSAG